MRFIVNLPSEEYESFERLFFAVESAHWFYEDFYRPSQPSLPKLSLKQFAARLFEHSVFLNRFCMHVDVLTRKFQQYKQEVPTCGAALLNSALTHVVLVRSWGSNARWGFPKGKLAKGETELACAIREVFEEVGFDMTPYTDSSTTFAIDSFVGGRYSKIFVVPNVPMDTAFVTKTRKEISHIQWVPLNILPDSPKAKTPPTIKDNRGTRMVFSSQAMAPFVKRLRAWAAREKALQNSNAQQEPKSEKPLRPDFPPPSTSPPPRKRSPRGKKYPTSVSANGRPATSPRPRRGPSERERNRTTFGENLESMNDDDRQRLFAQYVVRTDRLVAMKGLKDDDFWPVDVVTSNDFAEDMRRDAERALELNNFSMSGAAQQYGNNSNAHSSANHLKIGTDSLLSKSPSHLEVLSSEDRSHALRAQKRVPCPLREFKFDCNSVLAAMRTPDSS